LLKSWRPSIRLKAHALSTIDSLVKRPTSNPWKSWPVLLMKFPNRMNWRFRSVATSMVAASGST